jgi:NTE family protein
LIPVVRRARLVISPREQATSKPEPFVNQINLLIRKSGAFPGASDDCIQLIAETSTWFSIPAGNVLFSQGDPSEAIYITLSGLLEVNIRKNTGEEITVSRIGPGEVIGEMGCVRGEPRSATIQALHTSDLIAVSRGALDQLARRYPTVLLSLYRTVVGRLRSVHEEKPVSHRPRSFCLLPNGDDDRAHVFTRDFTAALASLGSTCVVAKQEFADCTSDQLRAFEAAYDFVVYVAESARSSWSRLCLNQADVIVIVVRGTDIPTGIDLDIRSSAKPPLELVLLWSDDIVAGKTTAWLKALSPAGHHHVRSSADVRRATRLLAGRGTGLVLSGGGARGLSHIGVARALADHGVSIDAICGTSIGAYIGAALAMEWDFETLRYRVDDFSRRNPLLELVVPRWSLLSGRGLRVSSAKWFGERAIEETPIRYACVTTDLTACAAACHRHGKLRTWVRASCSLPGIFPPNVVDDAVHIDGGLVNNLPSDIIRAMGVDFVLAVDVGAGSASGTRGGKRDTGRLPNIIELLMRVATMSDDARASAARQQCDVLLMPNVQHLGLLNWRAYDEAIKRGYDCAAPKIDQIKQRIADPQSTLPFQSKLTSAA